MWDGRKVLIIVAYHFPPEATIGAARPFRFYKYLPRLGWTCHVITASRRHDMEAADIETVSDELGEMWNGTATLDHSKLLTLSAQTERLLRWALLPGHSGLTWSHRAAFVCRTLLDRYFDSRVTVLSTYPPVGTHLAALQLGRGRRDIRWVADFRDPMAFDPSGVFHPLARATLSVLETAVFLRADAVIANCDTAAERYRNIHRGAKDKIHVLWNGFDPDEPVSALPLPARDHKLLIHAGGLYAGRNPDMLIESLLRLRVRSDQEAMRTRVLLVGPSGYGSSLKREIAETAFNEGWLKVVQQKLPRAEALRMTQEADGLLLLQPQSSIQVPGKLFEYVRIGRPVLALLAPGSPIESILRNAGVPNRCIYSNEPPEAADAKMTEFLRLPNTSVKAEPWFYEKFSAPEQTRNLGELIDGLWK